MPFIGKKKPLYHLRSPVFDMPQYRGFPDVSFCITHKDRNEYIMQTLPENLRHNDPEKSEFIVVDFGSRESLVPWLLDTFPDELASGYLKFFTARIFCDWHASIAKNTAHILGRGLILTNLDCDNYTGPAGWEVVSSHFRKAATNICFWQFSGDHGDGSYGRISFARDTFFQLGGYDESLLHIGYEDADLVKRAKKLGIPVLRYCDAQYNKTIPNPEYQSASISFAEANKANFRKSRTNLRNHKLFANSEGRRKGVLHRLDPESGTLKPFLWPGK